MVSEGIFSANRGSQLADKNIMENVGIVNEVVYIYIYILTSIRVLSPPQDLNETVTTRWCHYLTVIFFIIGGPA